MSKLKEINHLAVHLIAKNIFKFGAFKLMSQTPTILYIYDCPDQFDRDRELRKYSVLLKKSRKKTIDELTYTDELTYEGKEVKISRAESKFLYDKFSKRFLYDIQNATGLKEDVELSELKLMYPREYNFLKNYIDPDNRMPTTTLTRVLLQKLKNPSAEEYAVILKNIE